MTSTVTPFRTRSRRKAPASPEAELRRRMARARDLQAQLAPIEDELADHRAWILRHLETTEATSVAYDGFTAYRRVRHNWDYSAELAREMLRIRESQKWEQTQGIAIDAPRPYVALCDKAS
jgi:hypothetical protein